MATRTRTILGSTLLVLLLAVGGLAAAHPDDDYPPTPPPETELPTETPSPTESVLPTETVAPTETPVPTETPTEDVEVLPRVIERLPVTGGAIGFLLAAATVLVLVGAAVTRLARRERGSS